MPIFKKNSIFQNMYHNVNLCMATDDLKEVIIQTSASKNEAGSK
jgi:hypothetical protein